MSTFELHIGGLPAHAQEKAMDIVEDLMVQWSMDNYFPEDADDIIFEKINEMMEEDHV